MKTIHIEIVTKNGVTFEKGGLQNLNRIVTATIIKPSASNNHKRLKPGKEFAVNLNIASKRKKLIQDNSDSSKAPSLLPAIDLNIINRINPKTANIPINMRI